MVYFLHRAFICLSRAERRAFFLALAVFIVSLAYLSALWFLKNTTVDAVGGGELVEGKVGQITYINPILGDTQISGDITALVFESLHSLSESIKAGVDGRTYTVRLKDELFWSDGTPITSDDALFTVSAAQNNAVRSPLYVSFQDVETKRVSEREFEFILPVPYAFFSNTIAALRIVPKHIFDPIPAENMRLSEYNLEPVGSGPMKFDGLSKRKDGFITEYSLARNDLFYGAPPYLDKITFKFYETATALRDAFNRGEIRAFLAVPPEEIGDITMPHRLVSMPSARYYAVFFNPYANLALSEKTVRKALINAIDRRGIIEKAFGGNAEEVGGPLLERMLGYAPEVYPQNEFSKDNAEALLERAGYALVSTSTPEGAEIQVRAKQNAGALNFTMVVPDAPSLYGAAQMIADNLKNVGIGLRIKTVDDAAIDEIIRRRDYEMILFGHILGNNPDLFAFWHSSQRMHPGLNLAMYQSLLSDALIEASRRETREEKLKKTMASLQSQIIQDAPALFLFSPRYVYVLRNDVLGVESEFIPVRSDRFNSVSKWHVRTVRVFR